MASKEEKVGVLKVRLYRPFPEKEISNALKNVKNIAVLDQNISPGCGGILYNDIRSLLKKSRVSDYVFGLGGKSISQKEIIEVFNDMSKSSKEEKKWLM